MSFQNGTSHFLIYDSFIIFKYEFTTVFHCFNNFEMWSIFGETYKWYFRNIKQAALMNWFFGVMQSLLFIPYRIEIPLQKLKDSRSWQKWNDENRKS